MSHDYHMTWRTVHSLTIGVRQLSLQRGGWSGPCRTHWRSTQRDRSMDWKEVEIAWRRTPSGGHRSLTYMYGSEMVKKGHKPSLEKPIPDKSNPLPLQTCNLLHGFYSMDSLYYLAITIIFLIPSLPPSLSPHPSSRSHRAFSRLLRRSLAEVPMTNWYASAKRVSRPKLAFWDSSGSP